MNRILIAIFYFLIISCGNKKTKSSCGFEFFEKTSEIDFPEKVDIINCYDDSEGIIWLNLKLEPNKIDDFIKAAKMHQFTDKIITEIERLDGKSKDARLVDHLKMFMNDSIQPITKNSKTYLRTIRKEQQYVIYILNEESGFFWGLIEYPDWAGD